MKLPSAEEFAAEYDEELAGLWKDMTPAKALQVYARAVLEAAAELVEEGLSVDSGDPARWHDAIIVPFVAKIRKLKEEL